MLLKDKLKDLKHALSRAQLETEEAQTEAQWEPEEVYVRGADGRMVKVEASEGYAENN